MIKDYSKFFYSLLNSSNRVAVVFDVKKKILFANDLFYKNFSTNLENTINKQVTSFIGFSDIKLSSVLVDLNNDEKVAVSSYNEILQKKVELEFFKYDLPEEELYVLYIDFADELLLEANKTIKTELELVQSFFFIYREIAYINLNTYQYIYLTPETIKDSSFRYDGVLGKKEIDDFVNYVKPEYRESVYEFFDHTTLKERLKQKSKINMEYESTEEGWCRIGFICCSYDNNGEPLKALFTFRNNNSEKLKELHLQETMKDVYSTVTKESQTKLNILSRIGHDIKTPINSIIGMSVVAQSNLDNKEKLSSSLKDIVETSKRLSTIFSEVLDMSTIENGIVSFSKDDVSLGDLLTTLINSNIDEIKDKKHIVSVDISKLTHEFIIGDNHRLQQVFNNIFLNSIHYTKDEGHIKISVSEEVKNEEGTLSNFVFTIEDDGIGMSKEFLNKVFEPFERENRFLVRSIDGAGLGLSIAKSYIVKMGGDIRVESSLGKGTKVVVSLLAQTKSLTTSMSYKGSSVLLISRNVKQASYNAKILSSLGFEVETASSTKDASKILKTYLSKGKAFDFILVSWLYDNEEELTLINDLGVSFQDSLPRVVTSCYSDNFSQSAFSNASSFILQPLTESRINALVNQLNGNKVKVESKVSFRKDKEFKGKKVLVVEDNQLNLDVVINILAMAGIDTYSARNGKEALEMFVSHEEYYFDAILMDIQMPVMNGYEATIAIRTLRREDGHLIPIIAMSASTFAEDINASMISGMDDHIAKPINFNKLQNVLSKMFTGEYALRKNLELKAETDPFTKVLNKVAIFERIQKYISQKKVPLSALMIIDLDNFKHVNDNYGHSVGDQIIKETANIIKNLFREEDLVGRYGGDEFIVFMKDVPDKDCVYKRANMVINKIRNKYLDRFDKYTLTASIGGAFVNRTSRIEKVFNEADKALYRVKYSGKNKIDIVSNENVKK